MIGCLISILVSVGTGIAANALYDFCKRLFRHKK